MKPIFPSKSLHTLLYEDICRSLLSPSSVDDSSLSFHVQYFFSYPTSNTHLNLPNKSIGEDGSTTRGGKERLH